MFSALHAQTIAEAALILLAVVILMVSAVKVRLAWFGPPVSTRTNRIYFWVVAISLIAFGAILLTLFFSAEEGRVERNVLMGSILFTVSAVRFAGGWRNTIRSANFDFAAARDAEPGSYLANLFLLVLALAVLILGAADILGLV